MPLFDLPLAELRTYAGRNPRPADFDDYWRRALAELDTVTPAVELRPAAVPARFAECYDLFFTGIGGARLHAKYLRPGYPQGDARGPHPAVLLFHGYGGNSGDWFDKLPYVAQGYAVAALDVRGQGGISEDPGGVRGTTHEGHIIRGLEDHPDRLLYRQIFLDCAQLARIVMAFPDVDETRVGATGASQGGGLTLACAALEPRIKLAAPIYPFLCDYRRVWEMDLAVNAYAELREYFRLFDPRHEREEDIFTRLGYIDVQHLAPRIRARVLLTTGLMDMVCPPSTQFAAYNKITAPKELLLYPDYGHESMPDLADRIFAFFADL
jgi:cephalosporin-C deacetylase